LRFRRSAVFIIATNVPLRRRFCLRRRVNVEVLARRVCTPVAGLGARLASMAVSADQIARQQTLSDQDRVFSNHNSGFLTFSQDVDRPSATRPSSETSVSRCLPTLHCVEGSSRRSRGSMPRIARRITRSSICCREWLGRNTPHRTKSRWPGCWHRNVDCAPIPGTTTLHRLEENIGAVDRLFQTQYFPVDPCQPVVRRPQNAATSH
jgi:hypothetical protein